MSDNITMPLTTFLTILWGYKKGADLRDRAVPGDDIIKLIEEQCPEHIDKLFHIHRDTKNPDVLATIWQMDEWRGCGISQEASKERLAKLWAAIDVAITQLLPKYPMFTREMLRSLVDTAINNKDWDTLTAFGLENVVAMMREPT